MVGVAVATKRPQDARWIVMRWEGEAPEPVASAPTFDTACLMMVVAWSKGIMARIIPNPECVLRALGAWDQDGASEAYAEMWRLILDERAKWGTV
ncbi:MAG TPA: hypothetical protein VIK99_06190 [Thermaerobacter sp.]